MGLRYEIPRVPTVYHYVMGRKVFGPEPMTIKAMWKLGNYSPRARSFRRVRGRLIAPRGKGVI